MSRRLTEAERASFVHVQPGTLDRTRVHTLRWLPGSFVGITLGRRVFLTTPEPTDGTSQLLAHELVHVQQYRKSGVIRFYLQYLWDFARNLWRKRSWMAAYAAIPAEIEARQLTRQWIRSRAESIPKGSDPA